MVVRAPSVAGDLALQPGAFGISRLRWPESTNVLSDDPGTIQLDEFMVLTCGLQRPRAPTPGT